ncbi:MAG TPA: SRPBCC domain-containing protein [Xanthobacteraceae bacterium]
MPYTFTLSHQIPASPQEVYDAWLDSAAHSEMTGGEARMSDAIGAEVSALNGYITGRNLQLIPGERIVQSWRTTQFADDHDDSVITVMLEERTEGALLTLVHSNVPDDQRSYEEGGWQSTYFEPMIVYFSARAQGAAAPAGATARRRPAPRPRSAAGKASRAPGARAKSRAPRAKAHSARGAKTRAAATKKAKHAGATAKRKKARPASRKAARPTASRKAQKSKSGRRKKTRR